jgi:hypothetical protein
MFQGILLQRAMKYKPMDLREKDGGERPSEIG